MAKKLINTAVKLGEGTLLLEALESLDIDFPIEWGSNYVKWRSGRIELWGNESMTPDHDSALGPLGTYRRARKTITVPKYEPGTMSFATNVATSVPGRILTSAQEISNTEIELIYVRDNQATGNMTWYATGSWKV